MFNRFWLYKQINLSYGFYKGVFDSPITVNSELTAEFGGTGTVYDRFLG